ncbi:MAG: hypothetical protein WC732_08435 [Candidatus Omnitrophota bacterium]
MAIMLTADNALWEDFPPAQCIRIGVGSGLAGATMSTSHAIAKWW